jgi:hypothetical protein
MKKFAPEQVCEVAEKVVFSPAGQKRSRYSKSASRSYTTGQMR